MIPCYHRDIVEDDLALLTDAYRDQPFIRALLSSALRQQQELEDALHDALNARLIGEAEVPVPPIDLGCCDCEPDLSAAVDTVITLDGEGAQLDTIGRLVGELRAGRSDAEYLVALRVRVLVNKSSGLADQLVRIAALALPSGVGMIYREWYDATFTIEVTDPFVGIETYSKLLNEARMGGVSATITYATEAPTNLFRWANTNANLGAIGHGMAYLPSTSYISHFASTTGI